MHVLFSMKRFHKYKIADFWKSIIELISFSEHFYKANLEKVEIIFQKHISFICISMFFKVKFGLICFRCNIMIKCLIDVCISIDAPLSPDVRCCLNNFRRLINILLEWLDNWIYVFLVNIHYHRFTIKLMWDSNNI
jgi:hypothetical protein